MCRLPFAGASLLYLVAVSSLDVVETFVFHGSCTVLAMPILINEVPQVLWPTMY